MFFLNGEPVDVMNRHAVGVVAQRVKIGLPPTGTLSRTQALVLAAWLVAVVDGGEEFSQVLDAVEST